MEEYHCAQGMGIGCLTLRESAHMNPDLPEVHNTLFCGTFMGFTIIAVALLLGYFIRKPAPKEVDLFFGFMGGVCFFVCGTLSMHYPMIDEKVMLLPPEEKAKYPFFILCSNIALACFANALLYIFEACVLYDIWYYELRRQKQETQDLEKLTEEIVRERKRSLPPTLLEEDGEQEEGEGRDVGEESPEGKLGRLKLRCFCLDAVWKRMRRNRQPTPPPAEQREQRVSSSLPVLPASAKAEPQPGPSSVSDHRQPGIPRRQSFGGFDPPRIHVTPTSEEEEGDSDSREE
ncbi:uncharacterized protein LOC126336576 isoform X2 [Schistocerca gregaria]|uniref:uncharacterized protein LOC126336576 isoform X2 n=1 Tax=Schistocerca gregaria TaxID=7010 RepID=UPI00211EF9B5|nr:uncharacterized protein LOC126336576 isoform X2 [Schistocerca gregaria]